MYYEHGIFSTFYGGEVMPEWIKHKSKGPSISFTFPSSPNKLRGLNLSYVQTLIDPYWLSENQDGNSEYPRHQMIYLPRIKICNITKNLTWLYSHHIRRVNVGGKSLTFLSHWMFGENEMENGDQVTISVVVVDDELFDNINPSSIRKCGVSFVYDDGKNEKEEDPLSYYKSWNHIIGGDLSPSEFPTEEYNNLCYNLDKYSGRTHLLYFLKSCCLLEYYFLVFYYFLSQGFAKLETLKLSPRRTLTHMAAQSRYVFDTQTLLHNTNKNHT
jgi:hypothetical protein